MKGLFAEFGHIVDASIVEVPKQRNSHGENAEIKAGGTPESFKENPNKIRQKDIDARWTVKGGKAYYGYWADGAYFSEKQEVRLAKKRYVSRILNRTKRFAEHSAIVRENRRRSKIRKRVEHVFGFIENSMGGKFIRRIGMARAKAKIEIMNLVYNVCRYEQRCRMGAP